MDYNQTLQDTPQELVVYLVAKSGCEAGHERDLSFAAGDVVCYFPQRRLDHPFPSGRGFGRLGGRGSGNPEGAFELKLMRPMNPAAIDAPPAVPEALLEFNMGADSSGEGSLGDDITAMRMLPRGNKSFKETFAVVLNDPESCLLARVVSQWVILLIIISTVAFVLESLPEFHVDGGPELKNAWFWDTLEAFVVIQFTLEYLARLATCDDKCEFLIDPMNIIDVVAIVPWYLTLIGLASTGSAVLRIFRLARVVRVFKLGKYAAGLQLFGRTLIASADALYLFVFFIAIATVIASSMIYFAERGEWSVEDQHWINSAGEISQFGSIPEASWWTIVTLTTVGYGDVVPLTLMGRLIAVCTMLAGVLTIALPVSILGSNFQVQYEAAERARKRKIQQRDYTGGKLATPLQQELTKLGNLFAEMDGLLRVAQEKQHSLVRLANSGVIEEVRPSSPSLRARSSSMPSSRSP